MPSKAESGWSVTWTGHTAHRDEIADQDELNASEHLGCYGAALAHTLSQAGAAATKLRVTVETGATPESDAPTLMVEVRAVIPGMDQAIFESIARRAESACPAWKSLTSEVAMRMAWILEDPEQAAAAAPANQAAAAGPTASPAAAGASRSAAPPGRRAPSQPMPGVGVLTLRGLPGWLTPKMGLALVGMAVVGMRVFILFSS
jgi:hypothetical protein